MKTTKKQRDFIRSTLDSQVLQPHVGRNVIRHLLDDVDELSLQLYKCRKAIRFAHRAEWMVTTDWTDSDRRDAMWKEVKKLAGVRELT